MKSARLSAITAAICLLGLGTVGTSFADPVDFNHWSGNGNGYTWTVSDGSWVGSDVVPSVPLSPQGLFLNGAATGNYILSGKIEVENTADNDMIGIVFGYQGENDYYALDWKQAQQTYSDTFADEGFTLFRIDGSGADFWNHPTSAGNILYTQYGDSEGWQENTAYDFVLTYTDTRVAINISDGTTTLFDQVVNGSFAPGQFGAYNFSQAHTRYSDFRVSAVPLPGALWLLGSGLLGLASFRRRATGRPEMGDTAM